MKHLQTYETYLNEHINNIEKIFINDYEYLLDRETGTL